MSAAAPRFAQVRTYVLRNEPLKAAELATVLERLAFAGVRVDELTAPLALPDYRPYGRPPRAETLPAGTLLVSTAQPAKHYVQARPAPDPLASRSVIASTLNANDDSIAAVRAFLKE